MRSAEAAAAREAAERRAQARGALFDALR